MEYLYMNLLERHADHCEACEPMLNGQLPYDCIRGHLLEKNVLRHFKVNRDGKICSRGSEEDCMVLVEVSSRYWAVLALLQQVYPQRYVQGSASS
jgi:hypothetical protein